MIVVILVNTGTNDAIAQLVDKISDSFEKEQFILGVFIDMSKAFDTVDHSILLKSSTLMYVKVTTQVLNLLLAVSSRIYF